MSRLDCNECGDSFKQKKELIEHLRDELDYYADYLNSYNEIDTQLKELGEKE